MWLQLQETPWDNYQKRLYLFRQLCATVYGIWQEAAKAVRLAPENGADWKWLKAYEREQAKLKADKSPEYDAWLEKLSKKKQPREHFEDPTSSETGLRGANEAYYHCLYLESWRRHNRPTRKNAIAFCWEKQYHQLLRCQCEWIGMKSECCEDRTATVAVPIGCNHRLCPLCNWHRSEKAQRRLKCMFDRLTHPQFVTLTAPNLKRISKRTFRIFRNNVKMFIAQHKEMFAGGVYAIETTYNRTEMTWNVHAHVLVDGTYSLPAKDERVDFAGRNIPAFTFIKLALEFDWARLWVKTLGKARRKFKGKAGPDREYVFTAHASASLEGARYDFERWVRLCWDNALKEWRGKERGWQPIALTDAEIRERTAWNKANRRVLDIKPVDDRAKAAKEVLKYITKSADFVDLPECVMAFYDATKSTRLIQTFGSWYGINFDTDFDTKHMAEDWKSMKCSCGLNMWKPIGTFRRRDVRMDAGGHWLLRDSHDNNCRGTVPRPTIRALEAREEG